MRTPRVALSSGAVIATGAGSDRSRALPLAVAARMARPSIGGL